MNLEQYNKKYHPGEHGSSHLTDPVGEFREICKFGDLEAVKFLLHSKEAPNLPDVQVQVGKAMSIACGDNNMELVQYLFSLETSHNITLSEQTLFYAVDNAARLGKIDIIDLFFSPMESAKIPIDKYGSELMVTAARQNKFNVMDFLLSNDKLKNHVDIHYKEDLIFKYAAKNNNIELIQFLIFDMNIEMTKDIDAFLKNDLQSKEIIKKMFNARFMSNELTHNLPANLTSTKKIKI